MEQCEQDHEYCFLMSMKSKERGKCMSLIHFNVPPFIDTAFKYMKEAVDNHKICGDGPFTKRCDEWIEKRF